MEGDRFLLDKHFHFINKLRIRHLESRWRHSPLGFSPCSFIKSFVLLFTLAASKIKSKPKVVNNFAGLSFLKEVCVFTMRFIFYFHFFHLRFSSKCLPKGIVPAPLIIVPRRDYFYLLLFPRIPLPFTSTPLNERSAHCQYERVNATPPSPTH